METRDLLKRREQEVREAIEGLRRQLLPLEAELAAIRRAKHAIGPEPSSTEGADTAHFGLAIAEPGRVEIRGQQAVAETASASQTPYDHLTMKQLVIKALAEQFPNGATTRQLLEFFRDAWGRHIERPNLSPQISRLMQEGRIGRRENHTWFLQKTEPDDGGNLVIARRRLESPSDS